MTKQELISEISRNTGIKSEDVQAVVESMMVVVKNTTSKGESVFLRGFASFVSYIKPRKLGRNILAKTTVEIPAHRAIKVKIMREWKEQAKESGQ